MPSKNADAPSHGRLNLEQQRKRAKDLLRAYFAEEQQARARVALHLPQSLVQPKLQLADAQFVIARENGFDSWPKLKAHAESLIAARKAMRGAAPDTARTLHIRCGSDIRGALKRAGFIGVFHEFSDPFCQGPVRTTDRATLREERVAFAAAAYGLAPSASSDPQDHAYAIFDRLRDYERIVLWFEHDSYDQLILAYVLSQFANAEHLPPVTLICADRVPGVPRFIGLGQLSDEVLRWLWSSQRAIGTPEFALGTEVFAALAAASPQSLLARAQRGTPSIPPMAQALLRHLQELPSTTNGLALTEQLALETLVERGPLDAYWLFLLVRDREPLPFLGDIMFWHVLGQLASARSPAIAADPQGRLQPVVRVAPEYPTASRRAASPMKVAHCLPEPATGSTAHRARAGWAVSRSRQANATGASTARLDRFVRVEDIHAPRGHHVH